MIYDSRQVRKSLVDGLPGEASSCAMRCESPSPPVGAGITIKKDAKREGGPEKGAVGRGRGRAAAAAGQRARVGMGQAALGLGVGTGDWGC